MTKSPTFIPDKPCNECKTSLRYTKGQCVHCFAEKTQAVRTDCHDRKLLQPWQLKMRGVDYARETTKRMEIV